MSQEVVGITKRLIAAVIEGYFYDVAIVYAIGVEPFVEELEEEIRLSASPDARDNLYQAVSSSSYQLFQVVVSLYVHICVYYQKLSHVTFFVTAKILIIAGIIEQNQQINAIEIEI